MYLVTPKGLGEAAGPSFICPTGETVFKTSDCPGGSPAPDVQQQIADVWDYLWNGPGSQTPVADSAPVATPTSWTETLNANAGKIALGAGVLLVIGLAKR